jgi:hypothetical protein
MSAKKATRPKRTRTNASRGGIASATGIGPATGAAATKKTDPPILLTTVDLNRRETGGKLIWQFVYASQLYGTLFGIYANFEHVTNGADLDVTTVRLKLVNYQGVLNIGFTADEPVYKEDEAKFYFGVRGGSIVTDLPPFVFTNRIKVERGTPFFLTFCRMLYPMSKFQFPLGERPTPAEVLDADVPGGAYFDSEFYCRSGFDYFNGVDRPGMYNSEAMDLDGLRGAHGLGSPRCHEGYANLTITV